MPLGLTDVLDFYRRELSKLNWKEEAKGAKVAADSAAIAFTSPEGPAVLKLGRKDGETSVNPIVKDPDAPPKPASGRSRVRPKSFSATSMTQQPQ